MRQLHEFNQQVITSVKVGSRNGYGEVVIELENGAIFAVSEIGQAGEIMVVTTMGSSTPTEIYPQRED